MPRTISKKKAAKSPQDGNPYHSLPSRSAKRRKSHWKVRFVGFKLYDEDAELVERMSDMTSLTNLCTNVFRSYHKAQEEFLKSSLPKLSGQPVEPSEIELALIPMPAALWEAYLAKAQEISEQTGKDVGCEELMLRVLTEKISAQNVAPPSGAKLPKAVGH